MNGQEQQQAPLPRPAGLHRHFWALLSLLALEPALRWLLEALGQAAASAPQPAEGSPRAALEGAEAGQTGESPRRRRRHASNGEPLLGCQSQQTFRQRLLGPRPLQALKDEMGAGHPKIWKTCTKSLQLFINFREEAGCPSAWPLPTYQIQLFVATMGLARFSPLAMQMNIAALSYMSRMLGYPDPLQDATIQHMMEDLRQQTRFLTPLNEETLESLVDSLESVCPDSYERLLFRATFVFAFYLALKPEEIVVEDWATPNPELLYRNNCEILEDSVGLRLSVSETGLERTMFRITRSREHRLCPVDVLHSYLAVRPPGEGPLFMESNEDPLSSEHFLAIFYSCLIQIGLPPEQYSMHSFWLGAIVTAAAYRCPGTMIRYLARWPSRGVRRR